MFSEVAEAREFHFSVDGILIYCSIQLHRVCLISEGNDDIPNADFSS